MDAYEGTVETVAEPVAPLRVDDPVLEVLLVVAVAEGPGMQAVEHLERVLLSYTYFQTGIRGQGGIVEQVRLQCYLLGFRC